jgi:hypothetical protein
MVSALYTDMGFQSTGDNRFIVEVDKYKEFKTYIAELDE